MGVKEKLISGQPVIGSWLQTGSPSVAEIMADADFDFIAADMEHTDINEDNFAAFARTVSSKTNVFARVRENDNIAIRRVLDCGADGVIVPLVNNAKEAEKAVQSAKYPPIGHRGFAFVRANHWGSDFDAYASEANDRTCVFIMVESKESVSEIDEILEVEGVDGVFIGPYDLSASYGVVGQTSHPLVIEAMDRVLEACKRHHKVAGQHIVLPTEQNIHRALQQGYRFLALGMDTVFISEGAMNVAKIAKRFI